MAYAKTDYDTQIAAYIAALAAKNVQAADDALNTAEAILSSLAFNMQSADAGAMLRRRESLNGMRMQFEGWRGRYYESIGTAAETMFQAPVGVDGGIPNSNNAVGGPAAIGT